MKKFRLLGLVLTLCMCLAIAMPALATDGSVAQIDGTPVQQMQPYPPELPFDEDGIQPYGTDPSAQGWNFATQGVYSAPFKFCSGPIYASYCFYTPDMYWCKIKCSGDTEIPFSLCNYCVTCGYHIKTVNSYVTPKWSWNSIEAVEKMYAGNKHAGHYLSPYIDKENNSDYLYIKGELSVNNKNEW